MNIYVVINLIDTNKYYIYTNNLYDPDRFYCFNGYCGHSHLQQSNIYARTIAKILKTGSNVYKYDSVKKNIRYPLLNSDLVFIK